MKSVEQLWFLLLQKISGLIVALRFSAVPAEYKYFCRDTYMCKINQWRFLLRDHFFKKKYKTIRYEGEFAAEIQFCLPHAYWHFLNGTLKQTISFPGTKEIYFFSENHVEQQGERTNEGNYNYNLPRIIYSHDYDLGKWAQVPLKEKYRNNVYVYPKPILIIANRYNTEWDGPPVSFFSIEQLDEMIQKLKNKFTIIYNRPQANHIVNDNSEIYDLKEFAWLKDTHPEVLHLHELYEANVIGAKNFNHFQLCVYANCDNFISIHGGTATLASYFGGSNIIFSKKGPEHYFNCFEKLYPKFSGAKIYHAKTDEELKQYIQQIY